MSKRCSKLDALVEASRQVCESWLSQDDDSGMRLVDPVDQVPVIAHYGDSHLAASLIMLGNARGDDGMIERGIDLTKVIMRDWNVALAHADFHHDFNNFALCLVIDELGPEHADLAGEIKQLVLASQDSAHDTVNWLPMRAYVNFCRHEWVRDERFAQAAKSAIEKVQLATNADAGIEDRLPYGVSYNLQYNISTLATLMLLDKRWPDRKTAPGGSLKFLLSKVLPDGDVNYMGRGANQLFAWGPWLYALASAGCTDELSRAIEFLASRYMRAIEFLASRYMRAIETRNMMLHEFDGQDKSFWWDYHYCSVYHAHFLLWTALAAKHFEDRGAPSELKQALLIDPADASQSQTGLEIISSEAGGVVTFAGRSGYLAEGGPSVCAVWLSKDSVLFKGGLGPWKGQFGNKNAYADTVFQNHFGLLSQSIIAPFAHNRLTRKIFPKRLIGRNAAIRPNFAKVVVEQESDAIHIVYETEGHEGYCNIPVFDDEAKNVAIEVTVDGQLLRLLEVGKSRNQYGWVSVWRSQLAQGKRWDVRIRKQG